MKLNLFIIGLVSILGQVVILRELVVAFYGIELIYILAMGFWLFWTAIGALLGKRDFIPKLGWISFLLVLFAVLIPVDIAFIRAIRIIFGGTPGAYLPFHHQVLGMALALVFPGILLGLLFQWAAKQFVSNAPQRSSRWTPGLPLAYGIECLGAVAGGILSTITLKFGFQNFLIGIVCSYIAILTVILSSISTERTDHRLAVASRKLIAFGLLGVLIALSIRSNEIDRYMTGWNYEGFVANQTLLSENEQRVIYTKDSPYGRITAVSQHEQIAVFENGALSFETEGVVAEEFVYLASLQHPDPKKILILGGGISGYVEKMLESCGDESGDIRIDYVELDEILLDLAKYHLPPNINNSVKVENVTITISDPRRFLTDSDQKYDLILIGMSDPTSGQSTRFYTVEFFELCSNSLNKGGVIAFKLKSAENLWTPQLRKRNESIYRALNAKFPNVVVLPGAVNMLFGSFNQLETKPLVLTERYNSRGLSGRLIIPEYIEYLYTNERFFRITEILSETTASVNSDLRPVCYQYAVMLWLARFFPSYALWNQVLTAPLKMLRNVIWISIAFTVLFIFLRKSILVKRIFLVAIASLIGIIIESTILLYFQVKQGILYQDIGLLITIFMTGMAIGSLMIAQRKWDIPEALSLSRRFGVLALFVCVICFTILGIMIIGSNNVWLFSVIGFIISGFYVGIAFAFASINWIENQSILVSPLYAADLIGGCIGVVLASLIFVPTIGLLTTLFIMAGLVLASSILI